MRDYARESKPDATCYMCARGATSLEHAPPRCFFPKPKDVADGIDYRKDLIKVPSCKVHNTEMSKDDEYAFALVAAHMENDAVADAQYRTTLRRALTRSAGLVQAVLGDVRRVRVNGELSVAIKVDDARFERVMDKIARALYFHTTRQKWAGDLRVHATGFRWGDMQRDPDLATLVHVGRLLVADTPVQGANPTVFRYQLVDRPVDGIRLLRMEFYEGLEVFVLSPVGGGASTARA